MTLCIYFNNFSIMQNVYKIRHECWDDANQLQKYISRHHIIMPVNLNEILFKALLKLLAIHVSLYMYIYIYIFYSWLHGRFWSLIWSNKYEWIHLWIKYNAWIYIESHNDVHQYHSSSYYYYYLWMKALGPLTSDLILRRKPRCLQVTDGDSGGRPG